MASTNTKSISSQSSAADIRVDPPVLDPLTVWGALSQTPGVGVCLMDAEGRLLFINETSTALFISGEIDSYVGRLISEFQPAAYVKERLEMIGRVLRESRPMMIRHVFLGRRIESTVWPIRDKTPPCNRVIVVTHQCGGSPVTIPVAQNCETIETNYIDLGPLDRLTPRELEVLVLLGHGTSVPRAAKLLYRSPKTIERHKSSITKKLDIHSQAEMVAIVTAIGLEISDTKLTRMKKCTEGKK